MQVVFYHPVELQKDPSSSYHALKHTHTHTSIYHSLHNADTYPVLGVSGSLLQPVLQPCTKTAGPAKLLHHPAGVSDLLGGQQGLQSLQVAMQGLSQRGNRLGGHGGEETQLLPPRHLEGEVCAEMSGIYLFIAIIMGLN